MKKFTAFLLLMILLAPASMQAAYEKETSLRGVEQEESRFLDPLGSGLSTLTYLPRQAINGVLYAGGKTANYLSDEDFVRRVKDILYFYDEKFLWFPIVSYASGFRPSYGAGLYYKDGGATALTRITVRDSNYWSYSFKPSYTSNLGRFKLKTGFLALAEKHDDLRYYGLGSDPKNDPRNRFVGSEEYGIYTQTRKKLQWETSFWDPSQPWKVTYLGYYQRRSFEDHGQGSRDVREMFDHSRIPGFSEPVRQLYNELALEIDTRDTKKIISPGVRGEVYSGFSSGIGHHQTNLFRTGFDAAGFIPVILKNRLLVPRVTADLVENLNDNPIPFSEYPRQQTFRGVGHRDLIRSERVSVVPSLEYQWPLSHMLNAHVFVDTLFVGARPTSIAWHDGLWATGLGLDLHYFKHQLGRIEMAVGSEGFQTTLSIGSPLRSNSRKDW